MKPLLYAVAGALVAAAVVVGNVPPPPMPPPAPQPARPAWEYKLLQMTPYRETDEKKLNDLGAEGWEVAESVTVTANESRLVLRRPKR